MRAAPLVLSLLCCAPGAADFIFFNTFPINMILQYAKVGSWRDYRYGEKVYIILSLASKSLLTWLVFGGTFQPNGN
eukprot:COSAG05_NODE_267_length_12595_cov_7.076905_11_plen_76_part_00